MGNIIGDLILLAIVIPIVLIASPLVAIIFLVCGPFAVLAAILGVGS